MNTIEILKAMTRCHADRKHPLWNACDVDPCRLCVEAKAKILELESATKPCEWSRDDEDFGWDFSCGNWELLEHDNPAEAGWKFCPKCGHPLAEKS